MSYVNRQYSQFGPLATSGLPGWEHAFSQSFIAGLQLCPEQTRAQWAGEVPREYTDSTALGESMHEGIQYSLLEDCDSLTELVAVAHHHLEGLEWKYTKYSKATMFDALPGMLAGWLRDLRPLFEPQHVELPFSVPLYDSLHRSVSVCGTMDCVADNDEVWDWKSASREHEVWEHQRWATQPTVYTYANAVLLGEAAPSPLDRGVHRALEHSVFHYGVVFLDGTTQQYDVWRDESHVMWLRQQASQLAWMIEHGVKPWVLNDGGWWCSEKWCGKWKDCKGADMPVDWKSRA